MAHEVEVTIHRGDDEIVVSCEVSGRGRDCGVQIQRAIGPRGEDIELTADEDYKAAMLALQVMEDRCERDPDEDRDW